MHLPPSTRISLELRSQTFLIPGRSSLLAAPPRSGDIRDLNQARVGSAGIQSVARQHNSGHGLDSVNPISSLRHQLPTGLVHGLNVLENLSAANEA